MNPSEQEGEWGLQSDMAPVSVVIDNTSHLKGVVNHVILKFNSEEAANKSLSKLQRVNFSLFATVYQREDESRSIDIYLTHRAIDLGVTVDQLIRILKELFSDAFPLMADAVD